MDGDAGALAGRVEALELGHALLVIGVDAAHVVVGARPDRDRLVDRVDAGERHRQLARPMEPLEDLLRAEVPQIEQHVAVDAPSSAQESRGYEPKNEQAQLHPYNSPYHQSRTSTQTDNGREAYCSADRADRYRVK